MAAAADIDPVLRPDFGLAGVHRRLPRGSGSLPADVVAASHRARLMQAVAVVVADKGYAATSIGDLTAHAGISRATFYALYRDKADCFLACHAQCAQAHLDALLQAASRAPSLPQQLWDLVATHLRIADTNPWFARTFIVEALVATPASQAASEAAREALTHWLADWYDRVRADHPHLPPREPLAFALIQEAVSGFVVSSIRHRRALSPHTAAVAHFVFTSLGLTGWATHATSASAP